MDLNNLINGINSGLASINSPMRFNIVGPKQYSACFNLSCNGKLALSNIVFKGNASSNLSLAGHYYWGLAE